MVSWLPESASTIAQNDLESLLQICLGYKPVLFKGKQTLSPLALCIQCDGQLAIAVKKPDNENDNSETVLAKLVAAIRNDKERYRAVAIVTDSLFGKAVEKKKNSAIKINLIHSEKIGASAAYPYRTKLFDKKIILEEPIFADNDIHIWT
ncbi:hypothetical protein FACS1894211_10470 [Clostridia bacterium]|nr:hypothetical protein FACS1894211_10470 [Clostridia bacterium]